MKPEIASIHDRMAKGGNWRDFRDEIAFLHEQATTEEEYVTLLEAHHNLVLVGQTTYDPETWARLRALAKGEYKLFLAIESTEHGNINPVLLERVTRREVEAGRLDANDDARLMAVAGAKILGDSAELTTSRKRYGDWFFYGMVAAVALAYGLQKIHQPVSWLIAVAFVVGWFINELEQRRIKREISALRAQPS